jgi:hypothetical protein
MEPCGWYLFVLVVLFISLLVMFMFLQAMFMWILSFQGFNDNSISERLLTRQATHLFLLLQILCPQHPVDRSGKWIKQVKVVGL